MFFFTHLYISRALYRYFSKYYELNQSDFAYGNIKPDLPQNYQYHHTLENCLFTAYNLSNRIIGKDIPDQELSVDLGEICHYVCDFFCYCHTNEEIHDKKLSHLIYELRLHREFHKHFSDQEEIICPSRREPRKDIATIIIEMRRSYFLQSKGMIRDIEYALQTVTWVCESLLFYRHNTIPQSMEHQIPTTVYKI